LGLRRTREQGSGRGYITKNFMICTQQILFGDQIKNNEMGRACGTYRTQKGIKGFDGGGGSEEQRPLGKLKRKWMDNIKRDL